MWNLMWNRGTLRMEDHAFVASTAVVTEAAAERYYYGRPLGQVIGGPPSPTEENTRRLFHRGSPEIQGHPESWNPMMKVNEGFREHLERYSEGIPEEVSHFWGRLRRGFSDLAFGQSP